MNTGITPNLLHSVTAALATHGEPEGSMVELRISDDEQLVVRINRLDGSHRVYYFEVDGDNAFLNGWD